MEFEGLRRKLMLLFEDVIDAEGEVGGGMALRVSLGEWIGGTEVVESSGWLNGTPSAAALE